MKESYYMVREDTNHGYNMVREDTNHGGSGWWRHEPGLQYGPWRHEPWQRRHERWWPREWTSSSKWFVKTRMGLQYAPWRHEPWQQRESTFILQVVREDTNHGSEDTNDGGRGNELHLPSGSWRHERGYNMLHEDTNHGSSGNQLSSYKWLVKTRTMAAKTRTMAAAEMNFHPPSGS